MCVESKNLYRSPKKVSSGLVYGFTFLHIGCEVIPVYIGSNYRAQLLLIGGFSSLSHIPRLAVSIPVLAVCCSMEKALQFPRLAVSIPVLAVCCSMEKALQFPRLAVSIPVLAVCCSMEKGPTISQASCLHSSLGCVL